MVADCCGAFGLARLEVGLDKFLSSSFVDFQEEVPQVLGQDTKWECSLELIGSVIEPGAHSGSAVLHRTKIASSVFCKWKLLYGTRGC